VLTSDFHPSAEHLSGLHRQFLQRLVAISENRLPAKPDLSAKATPAAHLELEAVLVFEAVLAVDD